MKKVRILLFGFFALFLLTLNTKEVLAFDKSGPVDVRFYARFVYPDLTPVAAADIKPESKINYVPHYSSVYMDYLVQPSQVLRNTKFIPNIGNGIYSDSYTSPSISNKIINAYNSMEGSRVSYNSLFIDTKDSVKSLTLIQSVGKNYYSTFYSNGNTIPTKVGNYYVKGSFVKRTIGGRTGFQYENTAQESFEQLSDIEDVLFASTLVSTNSSEGQPGVHSYTGITFSEFDGMYQSNNPVTFRLDIPQIKETFINQNHEEIAAADLESSLIQNNTYYVNQDSYMFGGNGQPSSLPLTYTKNGSTFEYKGWFLGDDFKTGIPQFDWKDIPDEDKDKYGKIRLMYTEKKTQYTLTGHWKDDTPERNYLVNFPSYYISSNPGSMSVNQGDNWSGTAFLQMQDNSGTWWDFVGWEDPIHAPGVFNPSNTVLLNNVDCDTDFYYIYRKRVPRIQLDLKPNSTVITESGKTIDWTLTINNTGGETLKDIKLLDSFVAASGGNMTSPVNTVVKNHSGGTISGITDASWTDNGAEFAAKNVSVLKEQKLTITFQTTVTGDIHESIDHKVEVDGNVDTPADVTSNIRIKDSDHHDITDPADGELSLLYAPNKFDFGFHEKKNNGIVQTVSLKQNQYNNKTINEGFYVKLQDPRNNLAGNNWKLTASLKYFSDSSNVILSAQPTIDLGNFSAEVAADANTGTESFSSTSNVTVASGTISLVGGGGTIPVMNSQNLKNKGTWLLRIPFNDVKLHIPADVGEEGKGYTSELTWTLNDTI